MIVRFIATIAAMLMLGALAAAQEYSIRANRGLNLRAAPSLTADIAGTVRSGAILQVVGESGRWLMVNWPGNDVWLANWVDFSRVDNSSQPPTPDRNIISSRQLLLRRSPVQQRSRVDKRLLGLSKWAMRHVKRIIKCKPHESCEHLKRGR